MISRSPKASRAWPGCAGPGPAQQGADAGRQLLRRERLGEVVVGARLEAGHHVVGVGAGRDHHDRARRWRGGATGTARSRPCPGSMMSISTTSAGSRPKASMASSPLAVSSTVQPSSSRAIFTAVRMRSSSSTVRMRVPTTECVPYPAPFRACRRTARPWMDSAATALGRASSTVGPSPTRSWSRRRRPVGIPARHVRRGAAGRARRHAVAPARAGGAAQPAARCSTSVAGRARRRWPWCRRPGSIVGVDESRRVLDALRRRLPARAACACQTVVGEWPAAADRWRRPTSSCATTCSTTSRDLVAVRRRAHRPGPAAGRRGAGRRPPARWRWRRCGSTSGSSTGPTGRRRATAVAVLTEARHRAASWPQAPGHWRTPRRSRCDLARRRLCLPAEREAEVAAALAVLPPTPDDVWTFAWPGDA